jgi:replicative DNA helicase Mcm
MIDATIQIEKFKDFLETQYNKKIQDIINSGKTSLVVDFLELSKFDLELSEELLESPEETIKAAEIALSQLDISSNNLKRVRFFNLPASQAVTIRNIRSLDLNKFISVLGIVRQASDVRPQVTIAKFECPSCGNTITIPQLDTKFKEPTRCSCGRHGKFRLLSKELVDVQRLIIEEAPETLDGGDQPKRIAVFLSEDLVEPKMEKKTTPGSKVKITGLVKEIPLISKSGAQSTRYDLIIESNYIEPTDEIYEEIDISPEDEAEIRKLADDDKIYDKLRESIAPSIYGHLEIKEALSLQMFGGVRKVKDDGTKQRGDMHILLVGDPGSGKSQTLQFIAKAAPKARFISGRGATGAGITATVVKDEFLRGWALEAGAMVLANKGMAIIDELDKMSPEDRSALHEALEQQTVTISKANIQATLRAETTVLAAANPKMGRFDPYTPIAAQIDLPPTLINRFDLIFPVKDLPNREKDERIARHVLATHQNPNAAQPVISSQLLKKYISFARQNYNPVLTDAAINEITNFYVSLRNEGNTGDESGIKRIPITARQLEALVRLSEASARVRLSDKVTKKDAQRAIKLLEYCLMQIGIDKETGKIDIDKIGTGITATTRNRIHILREAIEELETRLGKTIPLEEVVIEAVKKGIDEDKLEELIESMKRAGEIFEPKRGFIQKI